MDNNIPLITCTLYFLLVSAFASNVKDVIHLDLARLRGKVIPNPPPSAWKQFENISPKNDSTIYCSGGTFPSDVFCDVSSLERVKFFGLQPVTTNFYLKYPHPTRAQAECFLSFENSEDSSPSRLEYKSSSCYASPDSSAEWLSHLEWQLQQGEVAAVPNNPLPKALEVGDVAVLEMNDRSTENLSFKCKRRFKRVGAGPRGAGPPSPVAFDLDSAVCISSAPPPRPPPSPPTA